MNDEGWQPLKDNDLAPEPEKADGEPLSAVADFYVADGGKS